MREIDDETLLRFEEGRLVVIKSPACSKCKLLFQKYPEFQDLDFDAYTFDSNSSEGVRKFFEEKGIFAAPATMLSENGDVAIRTNVEVAALAEYIMEVTRCS